MNGYRAMVVSGFAVLLSSAGCAVAAADPTTSALKTSAIDRLNGYWQAPPPTMERETGVTPGNKNDAPPDLSPPERLAMSLQPWALEIHNKYLEVIEARRAISLETPTLDNMCLPFAIPADGAAAYGFPLQILSTPKLVAILMQLDHQMRIIRIGGKHPAVVHPSWYGDSIGHWEGDTLVADTVGFNERSEIQEYPGGWPHTDKLHVTERYRVAADGSHIDAIWTYDDPGSLTAPFVSTKTLLRGDLYQEFVNAENNVIFPCPTAEAGSPYQIPNMKYLEGMLREAQQTAATANTAPTTSATTAPVVIHPDTLPGNRDATQLRPGEVFVPFAGGGPPPWDSGPLAPGPTLAAATAAAQAAIATCVATAQANIGVVVVDSIGQPRAALAGDGVRGWHIYSATHKALAALAFKKPSSQVVADSSAAPYLKPNMTTMPGAVPILEGNEVIGAIGVSGARSGEQDEKCAAFGAAALKRN